MTRRRLAISAAGVVVAAGLAAVVAASGHRADSDPPPQVTRGSAVHIPDSVRIKVEVLNASTVRGLGRRATNHLRDHGFDVVEVGTSSEKRDSTLVLDRSHHPRWAAFAAQAMGGAAVAERPDSSHYVDLTVLVGATWRPPAEPFYP